MHPPLLDQDLGFEERVEHLHVQQLVAQLADDSITPVTIGISFLRLPADLGPTGLTTSTPEQAR